MGIVRTASPVGSRRSHTAVVLALLVAVLAPAPSAGADPEPRIVGGTPVADIDDFPHVAFVEAGAAQCGGFLVTPTWIATAAHCFFDGFGTQIAFAADITAYLDTLAAPAPPAPGTEVRTADRLVTHPDYDDSSSENDIALFRITAPSTKVPTRLASALTATLSEPGDIATVAGWGATSESGFSSDDLLWVDLPIVSDADCDASDAGPITAPLMICAGDLANGGIDSCQGDSGGPLSVPDPAGGWVTVGVVSFGVGCGRRNSPGVYTEVAAYRAWIKSVIPGFNEPPVAVDDSFSLDQGGTLVAVFPGAFDNDIDPDGDPLVEVSHTDPAHGTLSFFPNGTFTYQHDGSETTSDSFTYVASDREADSNVATVTITVNPFNDPPVAVDDGPYTVANGGTLTVDGAGGNGLLANDTDPEGDPLVAVKVGDPANGGLTVGADGSFTYVHDGSVTTNDSFTYQANDGQAGSNVATVSISITPPPPPPPPPPPVVPAHRPGTVGLIDQDMGQWFLVDPVLADLAGANEAPAGSGDPNGSGRAILTFNQRNGRACFDLDLFNLQSPVAAAHIHKGAKGQNGPVVVNLDWPANGNSGCVSGVDQALVDAILKDLDEYYVNVHTQSHPAGAVRGQLGGGPRAPFFFGNPGDDPFLGDWDGDGIDTPGMYRPSDGKVYLRNSNSPGIADIEFFFGDPGDVPLIGDWDGDGDDTVSVYRPSQGKFFIHNQLGSQNRGLGAAEIEFLFGDPFDEPFFGDFDGDGKDSVGVKRGTTFYWRNALSTGPADNRGLRFGDPFDEPLFGDWDGDGLETPGLYRPSNSTLFFRNLREPGIADMEIFADGFESGDTSAWSR